MSTRTCGPSPFMSALLSLALVVVLVLACSRDTDGLPAPEPSAPAITSATGPDPRLADLEGRVAEMIERFETWREDPSFERARSSVGTACQLFAKLQSEGATIPSKLAGLKPVCSANEALGRQRQAPIKPEPAEKPVYEEPEYLGAKRLVGTIRGPFEGGGVVLQAGSKYNVVEDAAMPAIATSLHGYVQDTGRTVVLANIGRDGREAEVVTVSSQETYEDDQREHREMVAEARKAHQEAMAEYTRAMAAYPAQLEAYDKEVADQAGQAEQLRTDLMAKLAAFAKSYAGKHLNLVGGADGGVPPTASASAATTAAPAASAAPTPPVQGRPTEPAKPLPKGPCGCVATDLACRMRCTENKTPEIDTEAPF